MPLLRLLGALAVLPAAVVLGLVSSGSPTWSGLAYALALVALSVAPLLRARRARVAQLGCALLGGAALLRAFAGGAGRDLAMRAGTDASARLVNRLVDEQDLAVSAARVIRWTGFLRDPDVAALPEAMADAYRRMHGDEGDTPSPVVATFLGLEHASAHDVLEVGEVEAGGAGLVFLHGSAGGFTLPCWEVARAAARAGIATVCPSTRWQGDWWSAEGEATVRETLRGLRARGARRLYLAGLSNGGIGASRLAPRLAGLAGLVLISGADPDAPPPSVPVLLLQGRVDAMCPAESALDYAAGVAPGGARYVDLPGGHFAFLLQERHATDELVRWLLERERPDRRAGR